MNKPDCFCETCGAKVVEYRHRFNRSLAKCLGELYLADGEAHLNDLSLTFSEKNNFQKLRYWFVVEMVPNEDGRFHSGVWRLTPRGRDFVEGRTDVPEAVWTYRAQPVRYEGRAVSFVSAHDRGVDRAEDYWASAIPHFLR